MEQMIPWKWWQQRMGFGMAPLQNFWFLVLSVTGSVYTVSGLGIVLLYRLIIAQPYRDL